MSLISRVPQILEKKRLERWVTVLEADELMGEPRLEFLVGILSDKKLLALSKPYEKKGGVVNMTQSEAAEFRKSVLVDCVKGWRGMTSGNSRRLCLILLENPELIAEATPNQWPFDMDDLSFIAEHMSGVQFGEVLNAALDIDAFAREEVEKTKKKSLASSVSQAPSSPPDTASAP
jgi:hypothetical protein